MEQLKLVLPEFKNLKYNEINGLTHKQIRITGESSKHFKYDFVADIFIHKRTRQHSIARIDTKDTDTLKKIVSVLNSFN
jgi:hypothetical protein